MKLHEITSAYAQLEQIIDDPEADENQIALWLSECQVALKDKATNVVMLVENLEATACAIKAAEERMADRRNRMEKRAEAIKSYVLQAMQKAGIFDIECDLFKITRRKNPQSVIIDDESKVPLQYLRQPEPPPVPDPKPDKKLILDHIKKGVIIDGCHAEQTERLVIK